MTIAASRGTNRAGGCTSGRKLPHDTGTFVSDVDIPCGVDSDPRCLLKLSVGTYRGAKCKLKSPPRFKLFPPITAGPNAPTFAITLPLESVVICLALRNP